MDFDIPERLKDLQQRTREFLSNEIIPLERDPRCTAHGPDETLRRELVAKGRKAGCCPASSFMSSFLRYPPGPNHR